MKKNTLLVILILFIFGIIIWIYATFSNFNPIDKDDILLRRISELELKIDSLKSQKDSIRTVIDSTHVKIILNEKHYQERINTIITQPLSVDSQFISDYIGRYIESHKSYFQ
jgi:uncharacterized membrane protein YqiK